MEFNELIEDFAARHSVENLVVVDGAASLDIDGIIVTIVASEEVLTLSAELGEQPVEGAAVFANLLLEANLQPGAYFAKAPEQGPYLIVRRLSFPLIDGDAFDAELENFVNNAENWRRILADFRPVAKAAAERSETERPSFGSDGFMQV